MADVPGVAEKFQQLLQQMKLMQSRYDELMVCYKTIKIQNDKLIKENEFYKTKVDKVVNIQEHGELNSEDTDSNEFPYLGKRRKKEKKTSNLKTISNKGLNLKTAAKGNEGVNPSDNQQALDINTRSIKSNEVNVGKESIIKPPVIIAHFTKHKALLSDINEKLNNKHTQLEIKKETTRIRSLTKSDFYKIKDLLKSKGIEFYTYTPRDEKPFTMVIKNITSEYTSDEIIEAIKQKNKDIKVVSLKYFKNNVWIIQLKTAESRRQLQNLKSLLGFGIKIENYRSSSISQCKNCQRFNHLAINCNMKYRCVKCGQTHIPGICSIPKKEANNQPIIKENSDGTKSVAKGMPLQCANCKQQHAASYKGCSYRKSFIEARENKGIEIKKPQNRIPTRFVENNLTFSQVAGSNNNVTPKNEINDTFDINGEVNQLFGKSLKTCLEKINNFIPSYKNLKDNNLKKQKMFELFFQICVN